jgi:hypothetical protein
LKLSLKPAFFSAANATDRKATGRDGAKAAAEEASKNQTVNFIFLV